MAAAPVSVPSLVYLDEQGRARIHGTRTKVILVAIDHKNGMDAGEIHDAYPYLSLAQIHAALAYYYEHQAEMDAKIAQDEQEIAAFFAEHPNEITREELERRLGHR